MTFIKSRLNAILNPPPVAAVLRLSGIIGRGSAMRAGLSLEDRAQSIERAFAIKRLACVAVIVNSPGGSPVQSALLFNYIRHLSSEKNIPVFAFVEDVAASGGYWLALAADEIWADASSILGSIGVVSQGFGLDQAIHKLGIERRLYTQGRNKAMLDPFSPENPEDVARLKAIQSDIHDAFKDIVRTRRANKLKAEEDALFNGDIWTGKQALALGLIDGIGDMHSVLRQKFGKTIKMMPIGERRSWLRRRLGIDVSLLGEGMITAVEERLAWQRFGL